MTTATIVQTREGMPLDEFLRRQGEQPFELIEGESVLVSASVYGSGEILSLLLEALFAYVSAEKQARIYSDTTFVLPNTTEEQWVEGSRIPDVMAYKSTRLTEYRKSTSDWKLKPLRLVPDLTVEIVSPTDKLSKVWRKASIYLDDGVSLVWVINPMRETVTIFAQEEAPITLGKADTLSGGDLLPGFSLILKKLFEE
jgi:Uma2 family endonuclease